jgi:hypothetical protein
MFVSPPAIMFDSELSPMLPLTLTAACRQEQELAHSGRKAKIDRPALCRPVWTNQRGAMLPAVGFSLKAL